MLVVRCYVLIEAEGKIVPSYAGIGERCLGSFGKWLVLGSSIFETFVAVLCMNIIIWNNVALLLPNVIPPAPLPNTPPFLLPTSCLRASCSLIFQARELLSVLDGATIRSECGSTWLAPCV